MRGSGDVDRPAAAPDRNGAAQPPGTAVRRLPIDDRILDMLAAHDGPVGICPSIPRLGALLGVSGRYVRQRLAALEQAGLVERVPVFERHDDPEWRSRGRRSSHPGRQTSSSYRVRQFRRPPGTPTNPVGNEDAQVNPPGLAIPDSLVSSALEEKEPAGGGYQGVDEGEQAPALHEPAVVPAVLEVGDQHEPSWANLGLDADGILERLRAQLGDVEALRVAEHGRSATDYRTARGRVIDLTGGTRPTSRQAIQDLHQAVDELDSHTCRRVNGNGTERCLPGRPCGRHTPRRRIRPGRSPRPPPAPDQARGCGWAPVGSLLDELRVDRQSPLSW
jgi:hypothetical protein